MNCYCQVHTHSGTIRYCALHASASELLSACRAVIAVLDLGYSISASSDLADGIRETIAKATECARRDKEAQTHGDDSTVET